MSWVPAADHWGRASKERQERGAQGGHGAPADAVGPAVIQQVLQALQMPTAWAAPAAAVPACPGLLMMWAAWG